MGDEFIELLRRQRGAVITLEAWLDVLEVVAAAGEHRLLALVLDEVEAATDALSALELARALVTSTAGLPPDVSARDMVDRFGAADEGRLCTAVEELRSATERLSGAKRRVELVMRSAAASLRSQCDDATRCASV